MAVTIHDVAKLAGVNSSTVSRVINGKATITPDTKERVQTLIWMGLHDAQSLCTTALSRISRKASCGNIYISFRWIPSQVIRAFISGIDAYLFALEDRYGLTIETREGEVLFRIDPRKGHDAAQINQMVCAWAPVMEKYRAGEISREEYDNWRCNYPRDDNSKIWVHVSSAGVMDSIVQDMKK